MQGTGAAHRVVVYLMTHETLLKQLHTFTYTYTEAKPDLDQLPQLFVFVLRYALITLVGHYLEGRHRYIALQLSSSGNATLPGLQSFKIRWALHQKRLQQHRYLIHLASIWRSRTSLSELLETSFEHSTYNKLTYQKKVAKFYGYDPESQFRKVTHLKLALSHWAKAAKCSTALVIPQRPLEKLAVEYIKSRMTLGATFTLPADLFNVARSEPTAQSTLTESCVELAFHGSRHAPIQKTTAESQGGGGLHTCSLIFHLNFDSYFMI